MKNSIELLRAEVEMKEQEIRKMQALIANKEKQQNQIELDPDDYEDQFDESLDDSIPEIEIGSLTYSPSYVLKNVDPTAYRCSLNDFVEVDNLTKIVTKEKFKIRFTAMVELEDDIEEDEEE